MGYVFALRPLQWLAAFIVLFCLLCLAYYWTAWRLVSILRNEYPNLWISMGCPEAIDSLMSRRFDFFSESTWPGPRLNSWLYRGEYKGLKNPTVTLLGTRLKVLRLLGALVVALLVGLYALERRRRY